MIAPGDEVKNRISNYRDDFVVDENYQSPSMQEHSPVQDDGLVERTTESIVALAKQRPVAVVVAGVAAGLILGWLTKRNS